MGMTVTALAAWRQKPGSPGKVEGIYDVITWRRYIDTNRQEKNGQSDEMRELNLRIKRAEADTAEIERKAKSGEYGRWEWLKTYMEHLIVEIRQTILEFDISDDEKKRCLSKLQNLKFDEWINRFSDSQSMDQ